MTGRDGRTDGTTKIAVEIFEFPSEICSGVARSTRKCPRNALGVPKFFTGGPERSAVPRSENRFFYGKSSTDIPSSIRVMSLMRVMGIWDECDQRDEPDEGPERDDHLGNF